MGQQPRAGRGKRRSDGLAVLKMALIAALCASPALVLGNAANAAAEPPRATATPAGPDQAEQATANGTRVSSARSIKALEIIGHRGARDLAPENTVRGIRAAFRAGAAAVEFDVNLTADRRVVLLHDFKLDRTTNCSGNVNHLSYRKLRRCRTADGGRLATLEQALQEVARNHGHAYVHAKRIANGQEARVLTRAVQAAGMARSSTLIASHTVILDRLRAAGARRLGYVFDDPAGWRTNYHVLIPFNVPINRALVTRAQRRGQFVIAVESKPLLLSGLAGLRLDGFMANNVAVCMQKLAPAHPSIRDPRVATERDSGAGWTETPRTTLPRRPGH